jgi:hypothetical protein
MRLCNGKQIVQQRSVAADRDIPGSGSRFPETRAEGYWPLTFTKGGWSRGLLRGESFVTVVEAADFRDRHDGSYDRFDNAFIDRLREECLSYR